MAKKLFKKGQSGNPLGRIEAKTTESSAPAKKLILKEIKRLMAEDPKRIYSDVFLAKLEKAGYKLDKQNKHNKIISRKKIAELIAQAVVGEALMGNTQLMKELWERIEGRTKDVLEINDNRPPMEYIEVEHVPRSVGDTVPVTVTKDKEN